MKKGFVDIVNLDWRIHDETVQRIHGFGHVFAGVRIRRIFYFDPELQYGVFADIFCNINHLSPTVKI